MHASTYRGLIYCIGALLNYGIRKWIPATAIPIPIQEISL